MPAPPENKKSGPPGRADRAEAVFGISVFFCSAFLLRGGITDTELCSVEASVGG